MAARGTPRTVLSRSEAVAAEVGLVYQGAKEASITGVLALGARALQGYPTSGSAKALRH